MLETFNLWIATGFGLGYAPILPGTFGALLGVPLAWWVLGKSTRWQAVVIVLLLVLAVPVSHLALQAYSGPDPRSIVVDEYLVFPLAVLGLRDVRHPLAMLGVFALYRVLDGLKPFPIYLAESVPGGLGIVLDDGVAAIVTWVVAALGLAIARRYREPAD